MPELRIASNVIMADKVIILRGRRGQGRSASEANLLATEVSSTG